MIIAPLPENELERLADLFEYNILDTIAEKDYDDITHIAADICSMPISLISLVDQDRQWFKSKVGMEPQETARDLAFCAHAILKPDQIFIVEDSSKDERFFDNPLVNGGPNVSFYAGVPLVNEQGNAMGSLCVIDTKPNHLTPEQESTLKALARQVVSYLEIRKKTNQLAQQKAALEQVNADLQRFAYVVAHDVKSPCNSLAMAADYILNNHGSALPGEALEMMHMMSDTASTAIKMVDGILQHTLTVNTSELQKEQFTFGQLATELKKMIELPADFSLTITNYGQQLFALRFMLQQVLLNLCTNAIKYNDKQKGAITISVKETATTYLFTVQDNGRGISKENQGKIFDLFSTLGTTDRYNKVGTGIGLATVQRILDKIGGTIALQSEPGVGSTFEFTIPK